MRLMKKPRNTSKAGWAMLVAMFLAFTAAMMTSVMFIDAFTTKRTSTVNKGRVEATYLAEGAVEMAKKELQVAIANWGTLPTGGTAQISGYNVPYTVTPTGYTETLTDASGIQSIVTGYQIQATARSGGMQSQSNRIINTVATPIFQFAVFYTNDLEVFPGPDMTLRGRVHSNSDIYIGAGNTLTLNTNYVRAVGDIIRSRKDNPSNSTGTVNIREYVVDPYDPTETESYFTLNSIQQMLDLGIVTTSGYDSNFTGGHDFEGDGNFFGADDWLPFALGAMEYWDHPDSGGVGHTVATGDHGIGEAVTPNVGSIAMFEESAGGNYAWDEDLGEYVTTVAGSGTHSKGYYHGQSDLSIIAKEDGTWTAVDDAGFDVTHLINDGGDVVTITKMYDDRQGGNIQVIEVDIDLLNSSGYFPPNGLLYASTYGVGEGTEMKGVKLVNGSELNAALTVVTDGGVYVQGDYNTENKKGASVIGDAVNLLSNSWDDTKSSSGLPEASDTTFNLAMITGNHETLEGSYNGGLENLPRFHESWSKKKCTIHGSFVNTWASTYATGKWKYGGNRYKAPNRDWHYDIDFNKVDNLPPFTPLAVSASDIVVW